MALFSYDNQWVPMVELLHKHQVQENRHFSVQDLFSIKETVEFLSSKFEYLDVRLLIDR